MSQQQSSITGAHVMGRSNRAIRYVGGELSSDAGTETPGLNRIGSDVADQWWIESLRHIVAYALELHAVVQCIQSKILGTGIFWVGFSKNTHS